MECEIESRTYEQIAIHRQVDVKVVHSTVNVYCVCDGKQKLDFGGID